MIDRCIGYDEGLIMCVWNSNKNYMVFHALLHTHSLSIVHPKFLVRNLLLMFLEQMKQDSISLPKTYNSTGTQVNRERGNSLGYSWWKHTTPRRVSLILSMNFFSKNHFLDVIMLHAYLGIMCLVLQRNGINRI